MKDELTPYKRFAGLSILFLLIVLAITYIANRQPDAPATTPQTVTLDESLKTEKLTPEQKSYKSKRQALLKKKYEELLDVVASEKFNHHGLSPAGYADWFHSLDSLGTPYKKGMEYMLTVENGLFSLSTLAMECVHPETQRDLDFIESLKKDIESAIKE